MGKDTETTPEATQTSALVRKTVLMHTERSALIEYDAPALVAQAEACVEAVDALLESDPEVRVYGKVCHQHRCVGFFSDTVEAYNYSRTATPARPMPPALRDLVEQVNRAFGASFNGVLVNKYREGGDYIGAHSDELHTIDPVAGILAISLGTDRAFRVRPKSAETRVTVCAEGGGAQQKRSFVDAPARAGRVLQMAGDFQLEFTHEIPVQKRVAGVRHSFTFRCHQHGVKK